MVLDNFRTIELIWDKANKSIIKTVKTASSDTTGRFLSVKILDGGQETTLNNAKLQLYWEHPSFNTRGTDDFTTVNNGGLFKLTFSNEMLTNIGELNAYLVLTLIDGKITSDTFLIKVFKGADDGVVVPSNGVGLVNQVERKIDKGNVTLNDLTQEVKLAMTGGSVAIVGEDAVGTENIKNDAVTIDKVDFATKRVVSNNLANPEHVLVGYSLNANTGEPYATATYNVQTIYNVKPNTQYRTPYTTNYYEFDENDNFIKTTSGITITTGENTRILKIRVAATSSVPFQVNEGSALKAYDEYEEAIEIPNLKLSSDLPSGDTLTWKAMGDSITEGYNEYPDRANNRLEFDLVNDGYGGASMALRVGASLEAFNPYSFVTKAKNNDFSNVDILTIAYGTNDWSNGEGIGTIDSVDEYKYMGALNVGIQAIYAKNIGIQIVLLTPLFRKNANTTTNRHGETLEDYANAIREIGKKYNLRVIDFYEECGFNDINIDYYTDDGLHPNAYGQPVLGNIVYDGLNMYMS